MTIERWFAMISLDGKRTNADLAFGHADDSTLFEGCVMLTDDSVKMQGFIAQAAQKGHSTWRDAHVGQEPHAAMGSGVWIDSFASHAAYCSAWRISSASRYG